MNPDFKSPSPFHKPTIHHFITTMIKESYPVLKVTHDEQKIMVIGKVRDPDWLEYYEFGLVYELGIHPEVFILKPSIIPSSAIHMYPCGKLCLYHPKEFQSGLCFTLFQDIIPWTIKWMHFYEIWKVNGNIWIGPESPHGS